MMSRLSVFTLAAVVLLGAAPLPAATAFMDAYAKVDGYQATVTTHEIEGKDSQDRTYRYTYLKPHFARADVLSGPGKGGGAVWRGGDTLKGHMGGFLSGIKQTINIHDGRAVSLRGDTIEHGSLDSIVADLKSPDQSESTSTINGTPVDVITIAYPTPVNDVTKEQIFFSKTTHLPVRRIQYGGTTILKQEDITSLDTSVKLTEADFN